jgi:histidinol dehydrogenase
MASLKIIDSRDLDESFFSPRRLVSGTEAVPAIAEAVRSGGDAAVREYTRQFDRSCPARFEIDPVEIRHAEERLRLEEADLYKAVCLSRDLAFEFASRQRETFVDFEAELSPGIITGQRIEAVERAGLYVPGGRFPLISSVIMCAAPAKAAGVSEIILCTPPHPHPSGNAELPWADWRTLAVASACGITRVFACGGAQAIAAMAYGTETIPRVNVIAGPGNKYVAAAKRYVYGEVGIDLLAGPSEVLVIADDSANPRWVAADLYAQAEHDPDAQAVLVTPSRALAEAVRDEVALILEGLPADCPAALSFERYGYAIIVSSLHEAAALSNKKAPEHLELALGSGPERDRLSSIVRNFGSLFLGHHSAEVLGDFAAGLNHTLPTAGSARFTGGLSVRHFLKTLTTLRAAEGKDSSGWIESLRAAEAIARAEGLAGHALAASVRLAE